jgi:hypothetical protein
VVVLLRIVIRREWEVMGKEEEGRREEKERRENAVAEVTFSKLLGHPRVSL